MNKALACWLGLIATFGAAYAHVCPLNDGWAVEVFPESEKTAARKYEKLRLPHTLDDYHGMRGYVHGNLHGSAVYRRSFMSPPLADRRSFLVFDGAGTYLTVRLNGKELCTRKPAGRLVSTIETTGVAREGENHLEVVCDHPSEIQDMPWHCGGCSGIGSEGPEPFGLFRKVRFETTDLVRIAPERIVYISSDGNYSTLVQADGEVRMLSFQLGQIEKMIADQLGSEGNNFIRIGKSLIINRSYIYYINVPKQKLVLSDVATFSHTVAASKEALKLLKELIEKEIAL
jgi:hypothetical protein